MSLSIARSYLILELVESSQDWSMGVELPTPISPNAGLSVNNNNNSSLIWFKDVNLSVSRFADYTDLFNLYNLSVSMFADYTDIFNLYNLSVQLHWSIKSV